MTKIILTESVIYGIAGAIVGIILTFVVCACIMSVAIQPAEGTPASESRNVGYIFTSGIVGGLYYLGCVIVCGAPLGFVLGAIAGASLAYTDPRPNAQTSGSDRLP